MKNAFVGYSYQEHVTSLMLAKMDVERSITEIEIEAKVDHKFDDIKLITGDMVQIYFLQNKIGLCGSPSHDSSENPFVPGFGAKDWNE